MTTTITPEALERLIGRVQEANDHLIGEAKHHRALAEVIDILAALPELLAAQPEDHFKAACLEWHEKTKWLQGTVQPRELGMHYADILRARIEKLQRDLAEAQPASSAGCAGDRGPLDMALAEYEHQAVRHGKTGENAIAVDAAAERVWEVVAELKTASSAGGQGPVFFVTKGLPEICKQIGDHPHHNITATTKPTALHTVPLYTASVAGEAAPISLADWSMQMAAKESGQVVTAGAHGFDDVPAPAAVPVEGIAELLEDSERAAELARRLVAAGPKAAHVSASETHEISDFVLAAVKLLPALASHPQPAAPQGLDLGKFRDFVGFAAFQAIQLPETDPRRDYIRQASELTALIDSQHQQKESGA